MNNQRRSDWMLFILVLVLLVAVPMMVPLPAVGESNVTHFKGVDVEDVFRSSPQDTLAVTVNATIAPTGTYQPLSAVANVGLSSVTAGTAGDWLLFTNTVTYTITFTDTGTLKLSGNAALGQYDTLLLACDGTNWLEFARVDN